MVGEHYLYVSTDKEIFEIKLTRQFTVLQGDSGTGKSFITSAIEESKKPNNRLVTVNSDVTVLNCVSLDLLAELVKGGSELICIIDEYEFMYTNRFFELAKYSNIYFLLISHGGIESIPYSVKEVYYLKPVRLKSGKHRLMPKPEFNLKESVLTDQEVVITEDSNSGYEFFKYYFDTSLVVSADGKSNIVSKLKQVVTQGYKKIMIIADGAAFGSCANKLRDEISGTKAYDVELCIVLPESFEYLILKSGLCDMFCSKDVITNTKDYANTLKYYSWEDFYTRYLTDHTNNTEFSSKMRYNKSSLNKYYIENYEQIIVTFFEEV